MLRGRGSEYYHIMSTNVSPSTSRMARFWTGWRAFCPQLLCRIDSTSASIDLWGQAAFTMGPDQHTLLRMIGRSAASTINAFEQYNIRGVLRDSAISVSRAVRYVSQTRSWEKGLERMQPFLSVYVLAEPFFCVAQMLEFS